MTVPALRLPLEDDTYLRGAAFSDCQRYRYRLWRRWRGAAQSKGDVNFIMLNPSTADADVDDPTIRRCEAFARLWGYGGVVVTNLFAWRATNPSELRDVTAPIGPQTDTVLLHAANNAALIVCAWGVHGALRYRAESVLTLLGGHALHSLRVTKDGHPSHPLYLPGNLTPTPFERGHFEVGRHETRNESADADHQNTALATPPAERVSNPPEGATNE